MGIVRIAKRGHRHGRDFETVPILWRRADFGGVFSGILDEAEMETGDF